MLTDLDLRLSKHLHALVEAEIRRYEELLGTGNYITPDAATTGMQCARMVGRITGLKWAMDAIGAAERDLTGKGEPKRKEPR